MAKSARKMPVKVVRVDLDGEWEGWWMDVRQNVRMRPFTRCLMAIKNSDEENPDDTIQAMQDLLDLAIIGWNFVDEDGNSLPANTEGFDVLPIDLLGLACTKVQEVIAQVPLAPSSS